MPSRNNDKNKDSLRELEKNISPILVINNGSLKPYIECFQYYPENIYQQPLGILTGFFEIKEYSEDSAYVVNFLNSVLKKEYYVNPKRPVTESLDSALHKVNVALSELAKHGNVNWLGKLDGAVCILEKNNLHFSVAGDAKVLLHRKNVFNDISEDLAMENQEPNPLKTFVNVSSGRLENKDKLLITSDDIFVILTMEQLTKNAQRFSEDKFIQFLKTALSNELEMASVIVVDALQKKSIARKIVSTPQQSIEETEALNVFSEKTFSKSSNEATIADMENVSVATAEDAGYTDKKTGHIYIQGQEDEIPTISKTQALLTIFKEHASDFNMEIKKSFRRNFMALRKGAAILKESALLKLAERKKRKLAINAEINAAKEKELALKSEAEAVQKRSIPVAQIEESPTPVKEIVKPKQGSIEEAKKNLSEIKRPDRQIEAPVSEEDVVKHIPVRQKISFILDEEDLNIGNQRHSILIRFLSKIQDLSLIVTDFFNSFFESINRKYPNAKPRRILPDFQKIASLFSRFTKKQKIQTSFVVLAIIVLPLLFNKFTGSNKPAPTTETPMSAPTLAETLIEDKNINLSAQVSQISQLSDSKALLFFDGAPYLITAQKVFLFNDSANKEFSPPLNQGESIKNAVFMQDLSLILLLTNQKRILSFSPISEQFKDNNIQIPTGIEPQFVATYLTYLYLIDTSANQIYRYPRAEGGFGEKIDWLKENTSLAKVSDMTIDDNVYFVQENKLNKLFKGKLETINFENSATPIEYTKIYTTIESSNIYVLDAKNARVITYAKNGELLRQAFNEKLKGATTFVVSEKNSTAYVGTTSGVLKLAL